MDGGTFFIIATYYNIHTSKRGHNERKGLEMFCYFFLVYLKLSENVNMHVIQDQKDVINWFCLLLL
jgi:hypothetical protein